MSELANLVAASIRKVHPNRCWYVTLPKEAQNYIDAIAPMYSNRELNIRTVLSILNEEFDIQLTNGRLRNHLRGDCKCQMISPT